MKEIVLIFGISGTLGKALADELKDEFNVFGTFNKSSICIENVTTFKLAIKEIDKLENVINEIEPDYIISSIRGDFDLLVKFHNKLAEMIVGTGKKILYCSSGNVFDKTPDRIFYETDEPHAESYYGKNKIECENILQEHLDINKNLCIVRFAQIFEFGSPRMNSIFNKIKNDEPIEIYKNLIQNRTSAVMLAKQIKFLMENSCHGIRHLGSNDVTCDEDFYRKLITGLSDNKVNLNINSLPEDFNIGLLNHENVFPDNLQFTNDNLVDYLVSGYMEKWI